MIFKTNKDIETDIKTKISSYIKKYDNNDGIKDIISIIRTYLYEMKIINEILEYDVSEISNNRFIVFFNKENNLSRFEVSMDLEFRNLKINKIMSKKILNI